MARTFYAQNLARLRAVVAEGPEFTSEDTDTDEPGRYY
jgi:hypothetical protein